MVRNASYSTGPNIFSMNGLRTRPSPCSPDKRAAVFEHEIGDLVGDRLELPHALVGLQVHDRPDVQAADRCVRVDAGRRAVALDELRETGRCSRAASRARPRCPRRTRATWRRLSSPSKDPAPLRAGSRFAPVPADRARGDSDSRDRARADPARRACSRGGRVLRPIAVELHAQQRAGIAFDEAVAQAHRAARSAACDRG